MTLPSGPGEHYVRTGRKSIRNSTYSISFRAILIRYSASHQGFFTPEALTAIAETTLRAATEFEQGRVPTNAVRA